MDKTPQEQAEELVKEMANALYEANGTSAGAVYCAHIAANRTRLSLDVGSGSNEYWHCVERHIMNML